MGNHFDGFVYPNEPYIIDKVHHDPIPNLSKKERKISDELAIKLKTMYIDVRKILDDNDIQHWVSGGTLLGAIRHKGFIPWDDDFDMHVNFKDMTKLVCSIKKSNLFKIVSVDNKIIKIFLKNKIGMGPPFIDILFELINDDKQGTCAYMYKDECSKIIEKENNKITDIFPLVKLQFEDTWVYAPNNYINVLINQYGENVLNEYKISHDHRYAVFNIGHELFTDCS